MKGRRHYGSVYFQAEAFTSRHNITWQCTVFSSTSWVEHQPPQSDTDDDSSSLHGSIHLRTYRSYNGNGNEQLSAHIMLNFSLGAQETEDTLSTDSCHLPRAPLPPFISSVSCIIVSEQLIAWCHLDYCSRSESQWSFNGTATGAQRWQEGMTEKGGGKGNGFVLQSKVKWGEICEH